MAIRVVPLSCPRNAQGCCRVEVSDGQADGTDRSVGCWRVSCVDCGRETNVGFAIKYGTEVPAGR